MAEVTPRRPYPVLMSPPCGPGMRPVPWLCPWRAVGCRGDTEGHGCAPAILSEPLQEEGLVSGALGVQGL